jgi:hypothetical protein
MLSAMIVVSVVQVLSDIEADLARVPGLAVMGDTLLMISLSDLDGRSSLNVRAGSSRFTQGTPSVDDFEIRPTPLCEFIASDSKPDAWQASERRIHAGYPTRLTEISRPNYCVRGTNLDSFPWERTGPG